jgi:hypothetical protein
MGTDNAGESQSINALDGRKIWAVPGFRPQPESTLTINLPITQARGENHGNEER